jgi:hypothetical protein
MMPQMKKNRSEQKRSERWSSGNTLFSKTEMPHIGWLPARHSRSISIVNSGSDKVPVSHLVFKSLEAAAHRMPGAA